MKLEEAEKKAADIVAKLSPHCMPGKILVVGSIRRKKAEVNDIDIVLIPGKDFWGLDRAMMLLATGGRILMHGGKVFRMELAGGTNVDIYFATELTWGTLVLIRTGSRESNIKLCSLAQRKGLQLKADGSGLINPHTGVSIATEEEEIFKALGLNYIPPQQRF